MSTSGAGHQRLPCSLPTAATPLEEGAACRVLRTPVDAGSLRGLCLSVCLLGPAGRLSCLRCRTRDLFFALLDVSRAAASPSDLASWSVRSLVYMLYQGFRDT